MRKEFNANADCRLGLHYMVDISDKVLCDCTQCLCIGTVRWINEI